MKKRIGLIIISVLFVIGYSSRVFYINANDYKKKIEIYEKGEIVSIGNNHIDKPNIENLDGFTAEVKDSYIVPKEDVIKDNPEIANIINNNYYYMIKIAFKNEYNYDGENSGINCQPYYLVGPDYLLAADELVFKASNDTLNFMQFGLMLGRPAFEVIIPFAINDNYIDIETVRNNPPKLQICCYPETKLLKVK